MKNCFFYYFFRNDVLVGKDMSTIRYGEIKENLFSFSISLIFRNFAPVFKTTDS